MRKRRGLAFNTALNSLTAPLLVLGQVLLVLVLADGMSVEDFGSWSFLLAFTFFQGYAGILDLGFSTSALRAMVHEQGANRGSKDARASTLFRSVYKRSSLVGASVIAIALPLFLSIVGVDFDTHEYVVVVVCFVCLLPVDMQHSSNLICLEARRQYPSIRVLQLAGLYSWVLIAWLALRAGASISIISVLFLGQALLVAGMSTFAARDFITRGRVRSALRTDDVKEMMRIGKWMAFLQVITIIHAQMDRTIIAVSLGVTEVARYQIPYKVFALGWLFLQQFPLAVFPVASSIQAKGQVERSAFLFEVGSRWTLFASMPLFVAIFAFAQPLIALWVGSQYSDTYWTARLFMVYLTVIVFNALGVAMLAAHGRSRELFLIYAVSVVANLIVSIALVGPFGIAGVVCGTIVGALIVFVPQLVIEMAEFGFEIREWLTGVLFPAIFVLVWTIAGSLVAVRIFPSASSAVAVGGGVALVVAWGWLGALTMPRARREAREIVSALRM